MIHSDFSLMKVLFIIVLLFAGSGFHEAWGNSVWPVTGNPRFDQGSETGIEDESSIRSLATRGEPDAQYHLGLMYWKGQEVERNIPEAMKWLREAAEKGHPRAQYTLGVVLSDGNSLDDARVWFTRAALQGVREAQAALGSIYAAGTGVETNYVEAYKWWLIASLQGDEASDRNRERLEHYMTDAQIREAVSLAKSFNPPSQRKP